MKSNSRQHKKLKKREKNRKRFDCDRKLRWLSNKRKLPKKGKENASRPRKQKSREN